MIPAKEPTGIDWVGVESGRRSNVDLGFEDAIKARAVRNSLLSRGSNLLYIELMRLCELPEAPPRWGS